jgi:hypothetical protein
MATKKKRNKKYRGDDARLDRPVVRRVKVEDKSRFQRWKDNNKQEIRLRLTQLGLALGFGFLLYALFDWLF